MFLTKGQEAILSGGKGKAAGKAMEILVALGEIYGADKMIPITSVQVAGVSYHNLGDAGLEFLEEMARDGKAIVSTTLNPAGMDLEDWEDLGIDKKFADKQLRVVQAFTKLGISPTLTCTPYLAGNNPRFGEHIAWSESSAVAYANSVIGAYTNREGGPSALASSLTGLTPNYGLHLDENRKAVRTVRVNARVESIAEFGALGYVIGKAIGSEIPYITGIKEVRVPELKSLCASIATFGGTALFHIEGVTPGQTPVPRAILEVTKKDIDDAFAFLSDGKDPDFVSLGCPHCSIEEVEKIAFLLKNKKVKVETWITLSRAVKEQADRLGYTGAIRASGAKIACDTCLAVAPLKDRFKCLATNSAKGCYYGRGNNKFKTLIGSTEECMQAAVSGKWKPKQ
ncbi:MAG: aconitase X catalytic domain-containing protein [Candidatus Micrarchaeota archaeon]